MHIRGHFAVFPVDLAKGFIANGAEVTLLYPFGATVNPEPLKRLKVICLETKQDDFGYIMSLAWRWLRGQPILVSLAWLILQVRAGEFDLVYWTDFKPDNQQSSWPLALATLLGLYTHRTAFTEHHKFSWSKHRWQRIFLLDRIRLRHLEMFVHSRRLLDWIRLNMKWPGKGHYVPWGLWPDPASREDRRESRLRLGLTSDARVLLVFGMQAIRRKQIDTLAATIRDLPLDKPLVILFAGTKVQDEPHPFDDPKLANKANLSIQYHEAFIPADMVKTFFAAADAVWAYYGDFLGASGVFAQAIAFGRLPICPSDSESGQLCRQYHVGLVTPTDDVAGVQAAILQFLTMSHDEQNMLEKATEAAARDMAWPNITRNILDIMSRNSHT